MSDEFYGRCAKCGDPLTANHRCWDWTARGNAEASQPLADPRDAEIHRLREERDMWRKRAEDGVMSKEEGRA